MPVSKQDSGAQAGITASVPRTECTSLAPRVQSPGEIQKEQSSDAQGTRPSGKLKQPRNLGQFFPGGPHPVPAEAEVGTGIEAEP